MSLAKGKNKITGKEEAISSNLYITRLFVRLVHILPTS